VILYCVNYINHKQRFWSDQRSELTRQKSSIPGERRSFKDLLHWRGQKSLHRPSGRNFTVLTLHVGPWIRTNRLEYWLGSWPSYPWLSSQVLSTSSLLFSFLPQSSSSQSLMDGLSSFFHYPVSTLIQFMLCYFRLFLMASLSCPLIEFFVCDLLRPVHPTYLFQTWKLDSL